MPPTRRHPARSLTCSTSSSPTSNEPVQASPTLSGLRFPFPYGAVGHDVAAVAAPLDPAALELLGVERGVQPALAQQVPVGAGFHDASPVDDVDDVGVDDSGQAVRDG